MGAEIIDLSHWQHVTDWAQVRAAGIAGVILKASQGSHWTDPTFLGRALAAQAAGLLVGAYHFLDATAPAAQAAHFLAVAGGLPLLALDIEPNSLSTGTATVEQAAEMAMMVAAQRSRAPLVYIGRFGPDGHGGGLPNAILARCPLWLPDYGNRAICPPGWTEWRLWQYTDESTVPGIAGKVDRSRWAGTEDELRAWWTGPG